jgi:hypothetical protein
MWRRMTTNVDQLLSFDIVIKLFINNPLVGFWFFLITSYIDNYLVWNFPNLITYMDDPIIIYVVNQSINVNIYI